eukprot:7115748-Pyramimonas_sp.AAC.1
MAPSWLPHGSLMAPSRLPRGPLMAPSCLPRGSLMYPEFKHSQDVMPLRPRPHVEQLSPAQIIHKIVAPIKYKGILTRDAPCHPTGSRRRD